MALTLEETNQAIVDVLVDDLDPREHVTTRAFFNLLRPEVADKIATFYMRLARVQLETAMKLRQIETDTMTYLDHDNAFHKHASDLIGSIYASAIEGWDEVNELMVALRMDLDGGVADQLDDLTTSTAQALLTNQGWEQQIDRQITATNTES